MNVSPGPRGLWPQTAERRPRQSMYINHKFEMNEVYKLSRRESKPLMGRPNVLSYSGRVLPIPLTFGINLGKGPPKVKRMPNLKRGKKINGVPVITPSPAKRQTKKDAYTGFPRQRMLFEHYSHDKRIDKRKQEWYLIPFMNYGHKKRLF